MAGREDPLREEGLSPAAATDVATIAKGGAVQIAGQISQRGLSFLFTAVAVRVLGTAGYGVYRQVSQVLAIAGQIGLGGFNYASMRFIARFRASGDRSSVGAAARVGIVGSLICSLTALAVLVALSDQLARAFADEPSDVAQLSYLLRLGAAYLPAFALMQTLRYCTQAYKTMVPSVVAGNIVQPLVRFVLGVGALLLGFALAGAVTSLVISAAAGAFAGAWFLRRMLAHEERGQARSYPVGPMVRFALPQAGSSLLSIQELGIGVILLGILSGDVQVGLFGIALSLQGPGTVFLGGIVNIWAPVVSDLHERGQIERLGSLYQTINRWIATFSFPVFVALVLQPEIFVRVFAGSRATAAAPVVAMLALGNFFYTGTGPTGYVISMTGRPGVNLVNSVVAVGLYVALGLWLVPEHGAFGMAIADALVTALVNSARVVEAYLLIGVQPFGRTFYKPVVASVAGGLVLLVWRVVPLDGLVADASGLVVGAIVYLGALRALGVDPEERMVLDRIRRRARRKR